MGKKPYIKPEIREEASILTVRAFVTQSSAATQNAANPASNVLVNSDTGYALQNAAETPTASNVATLNFWAGVLN